VKFMRGDPVLVVSVIDASRTPAWMAAKPEHVRHRLVASQALKAVNPTASSYLRGRVESDVKLVSGENPGDVWYQVRLDAGPVVFFGPGELAADVGSGRPAGKFVADLGPGRDLVKVAGFGFVAREEVQRIAEANGLDGVYDFVARKWLVVPLGRLVLTAGSLTTEFAGAAIHWKHLDSRRPGTVGECIGYVPGHGGDWVYVRHPGELVAAYATGELEPWLGSRTGSDAQPPHPVIPVHRVDSAPAHQVDQAPAEVPLPNVADPAVHPVGQVVRDRQVLDSMKAHRRKELGDARDEEDRRKKEAEQREKLQHDERVMKVVHAELARQGAAWLHRYAAGIETDGIDGLPVCWVRFALGPLGHRDIRLGLAWNHGRGGSDGYYTTFDADGYLSGAGHKTWNVDADGTVYSGYDVLADALIAAEKST
jgi:hypothetical protein